METDNVRTERNASIFIVTINRPRFATPSTATALIQALRVFDAVPSLSVAVLTGAGSTFYSGFDLTAMSAWEHE